MFSIQMVIYLALVLYAPALALHQGKWQDSEVPMNKPRQLSSHWIHVNQGRSGKLSLPP